MAFCIVALAPIKHLKVWYLRALVVSVLSKGKRAAGSILRKYTGSLWCRYVKSSVKFSERADEITNCSKLDTGTSHKISKVVQIDRKQGN